MTILLWLATFVYLVAVVVTSATIKDRASVKALGLLTNLFILGTLLFAALGYR